MANARLRRHVEGQGASGDAAAFLDRAPGRGAGRTRPGVARSSMHSTIRRGRRGRRRGSGTCPGTRVPYAKDLTPDGKTLLFDEAGEGYFHAIYVRSDGRLAGQAHRRRKVHGDLSGRAMGGLERQGERIGDGAPSDRGRRAAWSSTPRGSTSTDAAFFPDGKRLLLNQDDGPDYVKDLPDGKMRRARRPRDRHLRGSFRRTEKRRSAAGPAGDGVIGMTFEAGTSRPIPGLAAVEEDCSQVDRPTGGRSIIGQFESVPLKIVRFDLATARRSSGESSRPARRLRRSTPGLYYFTMTPDGKSYAYSSNSTTEPTSTS